MAPSGNPQLGANGCIFMVTTHSHRYTYAAHEILSERYIYCFAINLSNKFYFYCSADADCLTDCQLWAKVGSTVAGGRGEEGYEGSHCQIGIFMAKRFTKGVAKIAKAINDT